MLGAASGAGAAARAGGRLMRWGRLLLQVVAIATGIAAGVACSMSSPDDGARFVEGLAWVARVRGRRPDLDRDRDRAVAARGRHAADRPELPPPGRARSARMGVALATPHRADDADR